VKTQFIVDSKVRKKAVILPVKEDKKILDMLEDRENIKACYESRERKEAGLSDLISLKEVLNKIDSK
jgi:hypothetical protein